MAATFTLLVDGEAILGHTAFDVVNPATGDVFAQCPKANAQIVEAAIAGAKRAFVDWSACPIEERANLVHALSEKLEARAQEFANLLTEEQGKPLDQAMSEVMGAVYTMRAFTQMRPVTKIYKDEGMAKIFEHRSPLGVVAAITPWNFPLLLLINKFAPALVAGNTMVAKPAPTTPLTTLLFGELSREVLPPGVFNVICDQNDLGPLLTSHPDVAKVAFTGSTSTGKKVMASAASGVKRLTLELGGNDAAIVLDDVEPKVAARKVYDAAMMNAGQICVAVKRAYVPEAMYDEFCDEIVELANAAIVDDGSKQGAQIGPIQNKAQYEKVLSLIQDAEKHGKVIAGGTLLNRSGFFVRPTIVRDLPDDARLVREEQFGPVLPVLKYRDIDEVIERANDSEFGLGGTVWGADVARAIQVAMKVDSGTVWVNQHLAVDANIPFRGSKQSGLGSELGQAGFDEYTQAHIVNAVAL